MPEEHNKYNYFDAYCSLYAYDIVISGNHISMTIEQRITEFSGYTVSWHMIIDVIVNEDYSFMSAKFDYGVGNFQPDMYGTFEAVRQK